MGNVLGKNLRALRDREGITQQELADIAQVTRETVNKWESGTIGNIRTGNLESILRHFGLDTDDLRSETRGLAAQEAANGESPEVEGSVPIVTIEELETDPGLPSQLIASRGGPRIPVLSTVWHGHPNAFAIETDSSSMNRVIPEGCRVIVDPMVKPTSGTIVLVRVSGRGAASQRGADLLMRRLHLGSSTAMLSSETYGEPEQDLVMPTESLDVVGTVVWYQAATELA